MHNSSSGRYNNNVCRLCQSIVLCKNNAHILYESMTIKPIWEYVYWLIMQLLVKKRVICPNLLELKSDRFVRCQKCSFCHFEQSEKSYFPAGWKTSLFVRGDKSWLYTRLSRLRSMRITAPSPGIRKIFQEAKLVRKLIITSNAFSL